MALGGRLTSHDWGTPQKVDQVELLATQDGVAEGMRLTVQDTQQLRERRQTKMGRGGMAVVGMSRDDSLTFEDFSAQMFKKKRRSVT